MELIFLGTSAGAPTRERNVTGLALRRARDWFLFDCGEGTQHQLLRTSLAPSRLSTIFISHLHGDHVFGLFGLLGSRSIARIDAPIRLLGPPGLEAMVRAVLDGSRMHLKFELSIMELSEEGGVVFDDGDCVVEAVPVDHRVTCYAWCIREADRPGSLDVARARALGVPEGPAFGRLKAGEAVHAEDGSLVQPEQVLGPSDPGRRLIIAGDNRDPQRLLAQTGPTQLLVHEATFTEAVLREMPDDKGHSTAARVARAAAAVGVDTLMLTHFSARFSHRDGSIEALRAEARAHYGGRLFLAEDLEHYALARDGRVSRLSAGSGVPVER